MFLSDLSIKRPVFATMMIAALVTLGLFSFRRLSVDLWPEVEFPFVSITTEYRGASPEAVRALPRIGFHFVQRGFGRLRRLIDEINLLEYDQPKLVAHEPGRGSGALNLPAPGEDGDED